MTQAHLGGKVTCFALPCAPLPQTIRGLEVLWEVPGAPKGVLFLAHGCGHGAPNFWPPSQQCPFCIGLPEEVRVREAALRRGYAVVAVTSFNRTSKCWHNTQPKRSEDLKVSQQRDA
jgi:hypothetical protein